MLGDLLKLSVLALFATDRLGLLAPTTAIAVARTKSVPATAMRAREMMELRGFIVFILFRFAVRARTCEPRDCEGWGVQVKLIFCDRNKNFGAKTNALGEL